MRAVILFVVFGLLAAGCATEKPSTAPVGSRQPKSERSTPGSRAKPATGAPGATASGSSLVITNGNVVIDLQDAFMGKVAAVNGPLRFVVLDFSLSRLPAVDQRLGVYRQGLKVGELKVSGPVYHNNIVADLVAGEVQVGDLVRQD